MPFSLLGSLTVTDHLGRPLEVHGSKARSLLALLLTRNNAHVTSDHLEDQLWNGAPPRGARSTLQAHVCRLRSVLRATGGSAQISGGAGGYMLDIDVDEIDVCRFESMVRRGHAVSETEPARASDLFAKALDEWHGPALQDVRQVPELDLEAHHLEELHLTSIEGRLTAELAIGGHVMAIGVLQRLVDEHPYREHLRSLLMLALYRSGRQVEALRCFQSARHALAEIGVQPSADLRRLEAAIINDDAALRLPEPASEDVSAHGCNLVLVDGAHAPAAVEHLVAALFEGTRILRSRARPACTRPYYAIAEALAPMTAQIVDPVRRRALAAIVDDQPPAGSVDPAFQRVCAFQAVTDVLRSAATERPLCLVLDDVDQAGPSTLDLLEHIARDETPAPVTLIVSTSTGPRDASFDRWAYRLEQAGLLRRHGGGHASAEPGRGPGDLQIAPAPPSELAARAFGQASVLSARAGDDAFLRLGFEEASQHYRAALDAIEHQASPQLLRRTELLIALGRSCHAAYQLDAALEAFRRAAALASQIGDVHLLAEAAVGVATATEFAMADEEVVELLSGTLNALVEDAPVRVELLAAIARCLPRHDPAAASTALEAVRSARDLDAPRAILISLATSILVTWGPSDASRRRTEIDEVIERAEALEWIELAVEARAWRAATLEQLGFHREAAAEVAHVREWALKSRRPFFLAMASMHTIAEHLRGGEVDAAEAALNDLPRGADVSPNFSAGFAAQLFLLRRLQGRLDEFVPLLDALVSDERATSAWEAARVVALAETGAPGARDALSVAVARVGDVPRDWLWLATLALLADACIVLDDRSSATALRSRLTKHRAEVAVLAHGVASLGPIEPRLELLDRIIHGEATMLAGTVSGAVLQR